MVRRSPGQQKKNIRKEPKKLGIPSNGGLDDILGDTFPASDPSSHTGITGVGRRNGTESEQKRSPSHQRGDDARPTGQPTRERHASETAFHWEDEEGSE